MSSHIELGATCTGSVRICSNMFGDIFLTVHNYAVNFNTPKSHRLTKEFVQNFMSTLDKVEELKVGMGYSVKLNTITLSVFREPDDQYVLFLEIYDTVHSQISKGGIEAVMKWKQALSNFN